MDNSDLESESADLAKETGSNWFYSLMEDMAQEVRNRFKLVLLSYGGHGSRGKKPVYLSDGGHGSECKKPVLLSLEEMAQKVRNRNFSLMENMA